MSDSDKEAKEVIAAQIADEMETSESDVSGLAKAEEKDSSDNIKPMVSQGRPRPPPIMLFYYALLLCSSIILTA